MQQLGSICKVQNLASPCSGRGIPNQYELQMENGTAFQSYGSLVAVRMHGNLYLTGYHDYSKTTSKYTTEWTGYSTKERREGLKTGKFIAVEEY